jgi:hypothetical protein
MPVCSRCVVHALPCSYPPGVTAAAVAGSAATPGMNATDPVDVLSQQQLAGSDSGSVSRQAFFPLTPLSWASVEQNQQMNLSDTSLSFHGQPWIHETGSSWPYQPVPTSAADAGEESTTSSSVDTSWKPSPPSSHSTPQHDQPDSTTDAFQKLSIYISSRWASAEQGLDFMDRLLKEQVQGFATGQRRPYFIHPVHWTSTGRPLALIETTVVAQLYLTRTPQSDPLLLRAIDTQLTQIQRSVSSHRQGTSQPVRLQLTRRQLATHNSADDVATLQVAILYASMRIYRAGPTAAELIGRIPNRLMMVR